MSGTQNQTARLPVRKEPVVAQNNTTGQGTNTTIGHSGIEVGDLVRVAPGDLLTDRNIREATVDEGLVASIRDLGVLEPITAALTAEGDLRVRHGHRRTHAAIRAKASTVPVYVAASEHDPEDQAAEVQRVIAQRDENTHRTALSTAEEVGVVAQLAAFGLSPAKIAKQGRISRSDVDAALAVSGSALASNATARYDHLTLDQAQAVAEFEDDAEAVKALVVASAEGAFEHVASRLRRDRAEREARDLIVQCLTDSGVTVVEPPGWSDSTPVPLSRLRPTPDAEDRYDAADPSAHRDCPGHVAWIGQEWQALNPDGSLFNDPEPDPEDEEAHEAWENRWHETENHYVPVATYGCADPIAHGHRSPDAALPTGQPRAEDMSEEQREQRRAERALVIENNKAWDAAEPVRRDWLATLAKAKTPPKGTSRFLAVALNADPSALGSSAGNALAAEWLGKKHSGYGYADLSPAKTATENRCLVVALVQVLAGYEADLLRHSWRGDGTANAAGRYLRFLQSAGYTLADVEKYAISSNTV